MTPQLPLACYPLRIDPEALDHYTRSLGYARSEEGLLALARAVAAELEPLNKVRFLVARPAPQPLLAIWGRMSEEEERWLRVQALHLNHASANLRYVSYSQVHQDCELLARRLLERLGQDTLLHARFTAIPRGGLVILGLLAIVLGLEQIHFSHPSSPDVPLVVVDDCALTGARFGDFVSQCRSSRHLIFAPLYSHPELRSAIEQQESRVTMCLSAQNLTTCQTASPSPEQARRWQESIGGRRYWLGHVERLCFPWNEPASMIADRTNEHLRVAWRIVPPDLCSRNRPPADAPPIPIYLQPEGRGSIRPAAGLVFFQSQERVHLAELGKQKSFVLEGIGASIWRAIIRHGELDDVVNDLLQEFDVGKSVLRHDVQSFVDSLLAQGLLERRSHEN